MLNRKEIKELIEKENLIQDYINLEIQITPNGFDLTAAKIFKFESKGNLDFSNSERKLSEAKELEPVKNSSGDKYGWWKLSKGSYKVKTNETINMPNTISALALSRTSLLRMGAALSTGVWDAGFKGKSEFMLNVANPEGICIKQNARIAQLVFFKINESKGYNGIYQNSK
ncbi:MAG: deoxyuridine 5'-triphosphate nucleotidohydrolase [Candidatus Omnitrophota bacterium]